MIFQGKAMAGDKFIYILIGPKGSGKSFIGDLFDKYFKIHFVRVENWAREIKKDRDPEDENYIREFFEIIEKGISDHMNHYDEVVFESTGISHYFDAMYNHLKTIYQVIRIKIEADLQLCLKRVRTRDQSIHINISDDLVKKINQEVARKNILCEFYIENSNATEEELRLKIEEIIKKVGEV
jgi:shikimate kinase